jgi:hypothetical protein
MLWIQYVKGPVRHIMFWYFTRKIGGRVVGVVLTYLVFLGYHRHQNNTNPSNIRNHQLLHALDMRLIQTLILMKNLLKSGLLV